ncbi:hypothetical protein I8F73_01325 [Enterococcus faecalis]|nr:hypothetical protein [Enterococcus faecalis]
MREKEQFITMVMQGIVGLVVLALVGLFFFYLGMWQAKVWHYFVFFFG